MASILMVAVMRQRLMVVYADIQPDLQPSQVLTVHVNHSWDSTGTGASSTQWGHVGLTVYFTYVVPDVLCHKLSLF